MKTLAFTIATAIATLASSIVSANENEKNIKDASAENIVEYYIDASTHGQPLYINEILADEFQLSTTNQNKATKFNKKQVVKHFNNLEGIKHQCETTYQFIEKGAGYSIAKINHQFDNFDRTEYVAINHTADGWKIQRIDVAY